METEIPIVCLAACAPKRLLLLQVLAAKPQRHPKQQAQKKPRSPDKNSCKRRDVRKLPQQHKQAPNFQKAI
jgi:hypothetical protein